MDFKSKLQRAVNKNNSLLCVGLDPDPGKTPNQFEFNKSVIEKTADLVCIFKPQIAFYAAAGTEGVRDLKRTIEYIHKNHPQIPVILDAKRGDVGHTSEMYTREVFDYFDADAVTLNPYCGFDAVEPFAKRDDRGVFIICKTSNPSAAELQDLKVEGKSLYIKVAEQIINWAKLYSNIFLEIGATWPREIGILRKLTKEMIFLIAGVGAQGGDLKATLKNGLTRAGDGLIISSSRGIIYAQDPRTAAKKLKDEINKYR